MKRHIIPRCHIRNHQYMWYVSEYWWTLLVQFQVFSDVYLSCLSTTMTLAFLGLNSGGQCCASQWCVAGKYMAVFLLQHLLSYNWSWMSLDNQSQRIRFPSNSEGKVESSRGAQFWRRAIVAVERGRLGNELDAWKWLAEASTHTHTHFVTWFIQ